MKTIGIIAEYNPFHQGHKYLIERAKEMTGAERVVIIMSGNSVQRGDFAIIDEFSRAKEAVSNGADLVLELSYCYASQSAEYFAKGAVSILNNLGIVDYLCFGSENDDLESIDHIAQMLTEKSEEIHKVLLEFMKEGISYPTARQKALEIIASDEKSLQIIQSPNDILGIEYVKALYRTKSRMIPIAIKRKGADHNDTDFDKRIPSASAIRKILLEGGLYIENFELLSLNPVDIQKELDFLSQFEQKALEFVVPKQLASYLMEKKRQNSLNSMENYLDELKAIVITRRDDLYGIFEMTEGIEHILKKEILRAKSIEELTMHMKSKRFTYTRIRRILLNTLVGLTKTDMEIVKNSEEPPCSRILAFNDTGRQMLKEIKNQRKKAGENEVETADFLINKLADFQPLNELHRIQRKYDSIVDELFYLKFIHYVKEDRVYVSNSTSPSYIKG